jgi:hypothetical protein
MARHFRNTGFQPVSAGTPALAQGKTIAQAKRLGEPSLARLFIRPSVEACEYARHGLEARVTSEWPLTPHRVRKLRVLNDTCRERFALPLP